MIKKWFSHSGIILGSKNGYDIIDCKKCGFYHAVPIPTPKDLDEYYKKQFYASTKPGYCEEHERDHEWRSMTYRGHLDLFEKHMSSKGKRILDIGSGPGLFLKYAKDNGWDAVGIEPSTQAAQFTRSLGIEVVNDFLNINTYKKLGKFDVIHSCVVMEHLIDPAETLTLCGKMLKPGGILFISVANEFNPLQMILKDHLSVKPWWIVPPDHINYFTIASLKNLVSRKGFRPLNVTTSFPMELFILMGDNYIGNNALGKECHKRRSNLEFALVNSGNRDLKKKLYKAFSSIDLGRNIELLARKK